MNEIDYALMAFRMYLNKIDNKLEEKFYMTIHYLKDLYLEEEIHKYLMEDKIL